MFGAEDDSEIYATPCRCIADVCFVGYKIWILLESAIVIAAALKMYIHGAVLSE